MARKITPPSQPETKKSGSDGHAVKKCVNRKSEQRGNSGVIRHKMLDVRFFAEMEMRRQGVLEKMNDEISDEHEKIGAVARQGHRFGKNFENRRGQHEARAQRQKIFQVLPRPFAVQDKQAAKNIGRSRRQTRAATRGACAKRGRGWIARSSFRQ